jgi:hypothetical protein
MYNTTIAKLLAKENIDVQFGNYKTAWFDVKNRVLGLPMLKDMEKDVHDLFIGHEVGHALYTPFAGWHDSPEKLEGAPRSYINVTEDARIERFIQSSYPGLVGPFKRGYTKLVENGFFGDIKDVNWNKTKLIDKINVQAKLGNAISVPFNAEEIVFYKRAMTTTTFEQVVQLSKDILIYTKENQEELLNPPPPPVPEGGPITLPLPLDENGDPTNTGHDDMDPETDSYGSPVDPDVKSNSDSEDEDESDDCKETNKTSSESNDDDTFSSDDESLTAQPEPDNADHERSITDDLAKTYERGLLDHGTRGGQPEVMRCAKRKNMQKSIHSFDTLTQQRQETRDNHDFDLNTDNWGRSKSIMDGYPEYMAKVKKAAYYAVKEFEMKKAAFQWQRASTAKSGSLDMNKIHKFKFDEDIFARVTNLANSKNHGMIMLIDLSGSMSSTMYAVLDQLFHLVSFCKMVNIPFDVYGFTSSRVPTTREEREANKIDGQIDFTDLSMPQLISSTLPKRKYNVALEELYMRYKAAQSTSPQWTGDYDETGYFSEYSLLGKSEEYGSTPLNLALMVTTDLIKQFRNKHGVDKMNLIVLSDGDTNGVYAHRDYDIDHTDISRSAGTKLLLDNRWISTAGNRTEMTKSLLENMRKNYGCATLGFFIADNNWDFRSKMNQVENNYYYSTSKINREFRKNKCITRQNVLGYNEFYLVKGGKTLEATGEEFDPREGASNAQIRTAFKKASSSKKKNKILLTNFGRAIA